MGWLHVGKVVATVYYKASIPASTPNCYIMPFYKPVIKDGKQQQLVTMYPSDEGVLTPFLEEYCAMAGDSKKKAQISDCFQRALPVLERRLDANDGGTRTKGGRNSVSDPMPDRQLGVGVSMWVYVVYFEGRIQASTQTPY